MKIASLSWDNVGKLWHAHDHEPLSPQIILYFADPALMKDGASPLTRQLKQLYPAAFLVGSSTGGEIGSHGVTTGQAVASALQFESTPLKPLSIELPEGMLHSYAAGLDLGHQLSEEQSPRGVLVIAPGTGVNGDELVRGLRDGLPEGCPIFGGLAGDGDRFKETYVGLDLDISPHKIVVVGFFGNNLKIGQGAVGGWHPFGPERIVTRSQGNILYELDQKPALELYKSYLGQEAENLPGSALLFPLSVQGVSQGQNRVVRTILGIDDGAKSMVFAGDMPQGGKARLMMASMSDLVEGAGQAAAQAMESLKAQPDFMLMISCIGRRLFLGQRCYEEVNAALEAVGTQVPILGFYSYGEIGNQGAGTQCSLHNQTMSITTFREEVAR